MSLKSKKVSISSEKKTVGRIANLAKPMLVRWNETEEYDTEK
jgi:hypothetical protein